MVNNIQGTPSGSNSFFSEKSPFRNGFLNRETNGKKNLFVIILKPQCQYGKFECKLDHFRCNRRKDTYETWETEDKAQQTQGGETKAAQTENKRKF